MDYLWYSRKQAHLRADEDGEMIVDEVPRHGFLQKTHAASFNRKAAPPHTRYGDVVFYLDDKGDAHIVSSVTRDPHHHSGWDDIQLVATAEKATYLGGTKRGLGPAGRDFCAANFIDDTAEALVDFIDVRLNCALPRQITVGRALKLGRRQA